MSGRYILSLIHIFKVENGKIAEIAPGLSGGESIDLAGCTIVPGFVDIHIHGCVGQDACDADKAGLAKMAGYLLSLIHI